METTINTYYKKLIDLILELYYPEFINAGPGHCMKITGFNSNELNYLWENLNTDFSNIDTFIVDDFQDSSKHITATKLIEYRNKQIKPLLVLIPANSRTSAEDSYGNATFKEIALEGLEAKLRSKLIAEIPTEYKTAVIEIIKYLEIPAGIQNSDVINYLLALSEKGYDKKNIGDNIYLLRAIPDSNLIESKEKYRSRLNFNLKSIGLLSTFSKALYERITELPLKKETIQKEIVDFLKNEAEAKTISQITELIYSKYSNLNFANWPIPDLQKEIDLKIEVLQFFKNTNFKKDPDDDILVLKAVGGKSYKLKLRIKPNQHPKDVVDLKYFRLVLMMVDGGYGEVMQDLRLAKNTTSNLPYRDITFEINTNNIEQGSYFVKIIAEDENNTVLNTNDDFKDYDIQRNWEEHNFDKDHKNTLDFKLASDSDDFRIYIEDEEDIEVSELKKNKIKNVLQAVFKFDIDNLKKGEDASPEIDEDSNQWINEGKHTSTFYINLSSKHNYQINISRKLRLLENGLLDNSKSFGYVKANLNNNSASIDYKSINFVASEINDIIPENLKELRQQVFNKIKFSCATENGIFETSDIYNHIKLIKEYIGEFNIWIGSLKGKLASKDIDEDQRNELQQMLTDIQMFDLAKLNTKLPDGKPTESILLTPLHPLRLVWHIQLLEVFMNWKQKTKEYDKYKDDWTNNLENIFNENTYPENNPLVFVEPETYKNYQYSGELSYGWGLYLKVESSKANVAMASSTRQMKDYFRQLLNISKENYVDSDISKKLVIRHIKNYLIQHPYTDSLIINLINAGDANVFVDALIEIEKEKLYKNINYEIRIFKGEDKIVEHGIALKELLNPNSNVTEEAEVFSQPSKNRLFPKLRFSINDINSLLETPSKYTSHLSFLISPFPIEIELIRPKSVNNNFYLNGLITDYSVIVEEGANSIKWNSFVCTNELPIKYNSGGDIGINLYNNIQTFISCALATGYTRDIVSKQLSLNDKDKVLLANLHDYSDWVITFDRNLGPHIFDQPSSDNNIIPFLLDYVPGEEVSGISSFLTTKPTSEILSLLGPHFGEFDLDIYNPEHKRKIIMILEDVRAISSSLVLQLNSTKNKAFEVIGSAFTKRILEKKGLLEEAFLVPIDLHTNLFENLPTNSKSRADNLLVAIDPEKKEITITVIEIKNRSSLTESGKEDLKVKMKEQIENTIIALRTHFDPENHISFDRLDREIKNKELKSLLSFYAERAMRYNYLSSEAYSIYIDFLQKLDAGFSFKFKQLGMIFDFNAVDRHNKEVVDDELTFFTFGRKLISDILDPDSDMNTRRLEENILTEELKSSLGLNPKLKTFVQQFKSEVLIADDKIELDKDKTILEIAKEKSQEANITIELEPESTEIQSNNHNSEYQTPEYDILIGKTSDSEQFGILGESFHGKKIAIDLSETNTISLFGVQGGGKSYTIGTITEMVLKQFGNINKLPAPLAGALFHFSESMDYEPEFTSMIYANDEEGQLAKLKEKYGADPARIEDVIILTPQDKIEERQTEYPSIEVKPIAFNSNELNVQDWMFLLGAIGNDSTYIKQLKSIMKQHRRGITIDAISQSVEESLLLSNSQKQLANQKLSFAREYINDDYSLKDSLKPGRLVIVDLRDEFIDKDEALGLFVIMLNIFSSVKNIGGKHFNKFIVFDEAHKYMDNKDLTNNIVTAIREMRHKGVSIMIASQDPPSLPNEIIELSSIVLMHKFNSPQWLKHIQKSITQLSLLTPAEMSALNPGEGFIWASKATEKSITNKPIKISTRPRVTKHGGGTIQAVQD